MSGIIRPREAAAVDGSAHSFATNLKRAVASMLLRREDDCHPQPDVNLCEKPGMASSTMTWIIVGTVLGVILVATLTVLLILHFRRRKHDRHEDLEDRFQSSDYGLDELPGARKPRGGVDSPGIKSQDGSPNPYGRRSRDPLHAGTEPKYQPGGGGGGGGGGQLNGHLNPFDDSSSFRSGNGSSYPPSVNPAWPKRESSQKPASAGDS